MATTRFAAFLFSAFLLPSLAAAQATADAPTPAAGCCSERAVVAAPAAVPAPAEPSMACCAAREAATATHQHTTAPAVASASDHAAHAQHDHAVPTSATAGCCEHGQKPEASQPAQACCDHGAAKPSATNQGCPHCAAAPGEAKGCCRH